MKSGSTKQEPVSTKREPVSAESKIADNKMTSTDMTGRKMRVAVVGCGTISKIYLENCTKRFPALEVAAVADLIPERARSRAQEFGGPDVCTVEEALGRKDIDTILNLTIPAAHYSVNRAALLAGKNVHTEKPLAARLEDGVELVELARSRGLQIGCAPDTFLGAGIQTCVKLIAYGWIGEPVGATAFMLCGGHESWHPDPSFYYKAGGGPMFDMGPYYLTALVALLGPVAALSGVTRRTWAQRRVTSAPKYGEIVDVEVPTHVTGMLEFANGAVGSIVTSFDVKGGSAHNPMEIWGTKGSLQVPDPNTFGGPVRFRKAGASEWSEIPLLCDWQSNSRGLGLADMAAAVAEGRAGRASGNLGLHVLELMHGFHVSSDGKARYETRFPCPAPEPCV